MPHRSHKTPRMYHELADWFHLLTEPEDYKEPAVFYSRVLEKTSLIPVKNVLEMGSGGGNNASHMKARFNMTLTDISEDMLAISHNLNPECEHIQGNMRNLRLGRWFDAVFIHDAISYLATETQLKETFHTAFIHCNPGGSVLFCPDYITETFIKSTETSGHDDGERGLRYLDWTWAEKNGMGFVSHFVIIIQDGEKVVYYTDEHHGGVFPRQTWLELMNKAGFRNVKAVPYPPKLRERAKAPVFTGVKPIR